MSPVLKHFIIALNLCHSSLKCPSPEETDSGRVMSVLAGTSAWLQQLARRPRATRALSEDEGRGEKAKNFAVMILLSSSCVPGIHQGLPRGRKHFLTIWGEGWGNVNLTFVLLLTILRASPMCDHICASRTQCQRCSTWPGMHI